MERLIKKMGDEQAKKASGAGMSMWLKKTGNDAAIAPPKEPESRAHPASHHKKVEEKPPSRSVGMSSWLKKADAPTKPAEPPRQAEEEQREGASSPVAQDGGAHASSTDQSMGSPNARPAAGVLAVASPPGQAGEPLGSQECSSGKDVGEESGALAPQPPAESTPGSEDEDEDKAQDDATQDAGAAEPSAFGKYMEEVAEEEDEDEDELPDVNAAAKQAEASGEEGGIDGEQEDGDARAQKKAVKATDFDDEEEFFLAGGDISEAKRRKDWDFAYYHAKSDDSDDDKGGANLDDEAKQSKKEAKEAARKLQKDTERLLRERRCIIPPAHVERRPMTSLVEKLAAKAAERAKNAKPAAASDAHEEQPMAPPTAPQDYEAAAVLPMGMDDCDEDDDIDDDMVIVDAPGAVPAEEKGQPNPAPAKPAQAAPRPQVKVAPPIANPRLELKARLHKTVLARSEHLGPLLEQTAHAARTPRAPADAEEGKKERKKEEVHELQAPLPDSQDLAQMSQMSLTAEEEGGCGGGESQELVLRYDDENTQAAFDEEESRSPCAEEQPAAAPAPAQADQPPAAAARKYGRRANIAISEAKREEGERRKKNAFDSDDGYENDVESDGDDSEDEDATPLTAEAEEEKKAVLGKKDEVEDEDEDEDEEDDDDEDEEDDDEDDDEEEGEKPEEPAVPVKKSLADIQSIKKQSALRIGTLEAGYLRNEEKVLAYHEDAGVAEEDLGEGIDLMDTDGEDNEEEADEGSDAERQVAEGFIENAKYAGEDRDPSLLRDAQLRLMDEDDQKITDKIMDVIQGNMRRKRAAENEQDGWVPNARARKRAFNGDGTEILDANDGLTAGLVDDDDKEDAAAQDAAENARQRVERIKFLQQKRAQEAEKEEEEEEDLPAQPLVRKVSTCAPLAAFARSLSNSGRSLSGGMGGASAAPGQRPFGRGGSLLGSSAMCGGGGAGLHGKAQVATSRSFFFETNRARPAEAGTASDGAAQDKSDSGPAAPPAGMKRSMSFAPMPMQRKKTQPSRPMKRTTSMLLSTLDNI